MVKAVRKTGKKKEKKNITEGVAHIQSTFNNTIITITDLSGNVISWSSAGLQGLKVRAKALPCRANGCGRCRAQSKRTGDAQSAGIYKGARSRQRVSIALIAVSRACSNNDT